MAILLTWQEFVEGDFPSACFPDILPSDLPWARGSTSIILPPVALSVTSLGGPLRGRGSVETKAKRGEVVVCNFVETRGWNPFALEIGFLISRVGRYLVSHRKVPPGLLRRDGGCSFPPGLGPAEGTAHSGFSVNAWWINRCVNGHVRLMLAFVLFSYWLHNPLRSQCPRKGNLLRPCGAFLGVREVKAMEAVALRLRAVLNRDKL